MLIEFDNLMIHSFVFDQGKLVGQDLDLDALRLVSGDPGLHVWVDLDQPTDVEVKQILEGVFNFHPLAIEDCIMVSHLPKIEDYEQYLFMVIHGVDFQRQEQFTTTELDLFLGKEFLVTYHTAPMRSITATRERVKQNSLSVARGPDRLAHTILDMLVDHYKPVLDELAQEVNELEEALFEANESDLMKQILHVKKELSSLRLIIRPQREVLTRLARGEFKIIRSHLLPYFRDITDNLERYDATALNFADQLLLTMDVYLNMAQNETNKVIKVLTIITAVTTPLMVIGTWYGMNFQNMPELSGPYSYWYAMAVTVVLTVGLMLWLKLKKWI